jgi:phenylacetate-CoA ligase
MAAVGIRAGRVGPRKRESTLALPRGGARRAGHAVDAPPGATPPRLRGAAATHPAPPFDAWKWTQACAETWAAGLDPAGVGARLRQARLAALIESSRRASPFYAARAPKARRLDDFEPVTKAELMDDFDRWAVDRRITRAGVDAFVADPACIADAWLGRYLVWTSSGTSGHPGIFVQDGASLAAYDAIDALRLRGADPGQPPLGPWSLGRSFAFVGATGGHFAGHVGFERLRRIAPPWLAPKVLAISVLDPLAQVAERLQAMQPDVLVTYPSCALALAAMQREGALRIAPLEIWLGGEHLSTAQRRVLDEAFGCRVRNAYGASEFHSIAFECAHGRLHLNADWVILEAMDARLQPVTAGEMSHSALLTNLANRTQPLLRYRLDDSIRFLSEPCPCGCAFPTLEVHGRADDSLQLRGPGHRRVTIVPLALQTVIEDEAFVTQFQVLCHAPGRLELRFEPAVADAAAAFRRCRVAVASFLRRQGVVDTDLALGVEPPLRERGSGKIRRVVNLTPNGQDPRRP